MSDWPKSTFGDNTPGYPNAVPPTDFVPRWPERGEPVLEPVDRPDETETGFTYEAQMVQVRYKRRFRHAKRDDIGMLDEDQAYELGLAGIVEVLTWPAAAE